VNVPSVTNCLQCPGLAPLSLSELNPGRKVRRRQFQEVPLIHQRVADVPAMPLSPQCLKALGSVSLALALLNMPVVISRACFGCACRKITITAKTLSGNGNHLSELPTSRQVLRGPCSMSALAMRRKPRSAARDSDTSSRARSRGLILAVEFSNRLCRVSTAGRPQRRRRVNRGRLPLPHSYCRPTSLLGQLY
jgi:hypothetical protein